MTGAHSKNRIPPSTKTLQELLDMPEHMDLSQIEVIYRAEGNANLVLALPQFKKVLRLPKMQKDCQVEAVRPTKIVEQQKEDEVPVQHECASAQTAQFVCEKVGDLTMHEFMAYIEIIRRLLGNEFVCTADIVAIPKTNDRLWINEHIRAARPIERLNKEFCGHFGLLLPDATQLPAMFDVLLSNLQATIYGSTYAIEIKPKQGWLLVPSDVNDLFDLMPTAKSATPEVVTRRSNETVSSTAQSETSSTSSAQNCRLSGIWSAASTGATMENCHCRYCSMQLLKLKNFKINSISSYCPIQLFSGVHSRMLASLDALFACPQNNLRIYQNGNLIYGNHASSISLQTLTANVFQGDDNMLLIKNLLVTCLLRDYSVDVDVVETRGETSNSVSSALARTDTKVAEIVTATATATAVADDVATNVVEGVANVADAVKAVSGHPHSTEKPTQKNTKCSHTITTKIPTTSTTSTEKATKIEMQNTEVPTSIEMATRMAETKTETEVLATQAQINRAEILCLPKNCVLEKILHLQLLAKKNFSYMWQAGYAKQSQRSYNALHSLLHKSPLTVEQLAPAEAYMLAATALDCSIMLTFQEIKSANVIKGDRSIPWLVHMPEFNRSFLTKLTILDLDPKPDSHFHKYLKQSQQILECFALK